ncbi:MAG: hypothetical protein JXA20_19345 [Spirochaetes bacterium]|nr:hypothetical protein [Spirochaetota bacterium]
MIILAAIIFCSACGGSSGGSSVFPGGISSSSSEVPCADSATIDTSPYEVSVGDTAATYDSTDLVENMTVSSTITVDFSANTVQAGPGAAESITAAGVSSVSGGAAGTSFTVSSQVATLGKVYF